MNVSKTSYSIRLPLLIKTITTKVIKTLFSNLASGTSAYNLQANEKKKNKVTSVKPFKTFFYL